MDIVTIMLFNGYFLAFLFLLLLIFLATTTGKKGSSKGKIKEDIKKIKAQIEKD